MRVFVSVCVHVFVSTCVCVCAEDVSLRFLLQFQQLRKRVLVFRHKPTGGEDLRLNIADEAVLRRMKDPLTFLCMLCSAGSRKH